MAYYIRKNTNNVAYGVVIFTVDEEADIQNLPRYHTPGSTAYVIASGNTYMLNNAKKWVLAKRGGSSDSGSGSSAPININVGGDTTATTDGSGNVNIIINNSGCCPGGGGNTVVEDIEWDDLSDGQDDPSSSGSHSGGGSGGGCCPGGGGTTVIEKDLYWEDLGGNEYTPDNPQPQPQPDDPDPSQPDPGDDPTPTDPDEPTPDDPTPTEPDDPTPDEPDTAITLKTGFGGARVNASVTKDYDLTALEPGVVYTVVGTGKGYYQNELGENFDIDTTITVPDNHNQKTIIHLNKYSNQQNLVTGLEIKAGYTQVTIYYNGSKVTSQVSASINCTFEPVLQKGTRGVLRSSGKPSIVEENEYYTIYNVGGSR